ncbi:MAG: Fe2+-dependent dioxygenase [Proteobacteria bacterium]|nr:Fe2+-dependent dioxygenase [Pseudomonadota bacterium]
MLMCIPDVLDWPTLKKIRAEIGESEFEDGRRTAGRYAKRVKHNLQLKRESEQAKRIKATIVGALRRNPTFNRVAIPRSIRPPLISCYRQGMNYGPHVDDALMGRAEQKARSDISVTVALNSPEDYDGGELVIHSLFGEQEVKLPAGAAVIYSSSAVHRVAPVRRGERLAAVTWVQSYVRDPEMREMLYDLYQVREMLAKADPEGEETALAGKTYTNLLRMWSET